MTFWCWVFLSFLVIAVVPATWIVAHAVGMERVSWGRATLFAALAGLIAGLAMRAVPVDFFILKALAGLFAALLVSPAFFRLLMTRVGARAILGSLLLTVLGVGAAVLLIVV
jgi:hypothetical protein